MTTHVTLGVDIGGSSVKAAVHADGVCLRTGQSAPYSQPSNSQLHESIRDAVGPIGNWTVESIGLCVPGLLDTDRLVVNASVNVRALVGLPLRHLIPQAIGLGTDCLTAIYTDVSAAAFDVFKVRYAHGRLLVLSFGTGVGAAVLDDGTPLLTDGNSPGHIGQIDVSIHGTDVVGPDGGAGGLEGYIGTPSLRQRHGDDLPAVLQTFIGDEPEIQAIVRTLRICHAIYRPHHIVFCGGIGIRLRHLLPAIRTRTNDRLTSVSRPNWTLECGTDNFHAARGAAQLAMPEAPYRASQVRSL